MTGSLAQNLWAASELLVGFGIVMLTLLLLWGLTVLMSRAVGRFEKRANIGAPALTPTPEHNASGDQAAGTAGAAGGADPASADAPSDEEVAVVATAVALLLDRPHRLVHLRVLPSAWGQQGRRDTHSSHRMT